MFINRQQTGFLLGKHIKELIRTGELNDQNVIVLALPRGGIPGGLEIALILGCPLDVISSKKIGAPGQQELAIGAVTSGGIVIIDEKLKNYTGASPEYLEEETSYLIDKTKEQENLLRRLAGLKGVLDFNGKQVIVVDDGVATGMTAIAAACDLRSRGVDKLIFATPVASRQAYESLKKEYDKVLALEIAEDFKAVGQFYKDFGQVDDSEGVRALALVRNRRLIGQTLLS